MFIDKNLSWKIISGMMLAMGFLVSVLMTVFLYSNDYLEHQLMEKQNFSELERLKEDLKNNPDYKPPHSPSLSIYLAGEDKSSLPEFLRKLPETFNDELEIEDKAYFVLIRPLDERTAYIVNDISDFEETEDTFIHIISISWAILMILIFAVSIMLSRFLLKPISDFADEIDTLKPEQRGFSLSGKYHGLEIEKMTNALDRYMNKLDEYVERQHSFAAMASHELRTPLTVIQTSSELISSQTDNPEINNQCEKINRSTTNLADMILALLAITRDQPIEEQGMISVASVVNAVLEDRKHSIRINRITINNQIEQRLQQSEGYNDNVMCNINLLSVVLSNLLSNAIKHSAEGTITIDYDQNCLSIQDTGSGLDTDNIDKLFEFGVGGENKGGYGLGLYITRLICDKQNWILSLNNANPGTIARVRL